MMLHKYLVIVGVLLNFLNLDQPTQIFIFIALPFVPI